MRIEGCRIFLVTGSRSQTVNVCTPDNQRGRYQQVFRLPVSASVSETDVAAHVTLPSLEGMLLERGARDEGPRDAGGPVPQTPRVPPIVSAVQLGDTWLDDAIRTTEIAIDALVWDFVEHPYLHRVESSLHARLFGILAAHPIFAHPLPIGDSGRVTQPIHKEWPETVNRPEKAGRGNFDLAILSREQLAAASVDQFLDGRIAASIVIEMGLDYPLSHLQADHEKLVNSEVIAGFLVHFGRKRPRDIATEQYLLDSGRVHRTAYAHHAPDGTCTFKTLDGPVRQAQA